MGNERRPHRYFSPKRTIFLAPSAVEYEDAAAESSQVFELFKNRPNPFNPAATIRYVLYEPGHVNLKVYDTLGREVAMLVDEYQKAGSYEVIWSGTVQSGDIASSGVYFYRLRAGGKVDTRSMTLVR